MRRPAVQLYLAFIALVLVGSALTPGALWGVSAWGAVSFTAAAVVSAALLVPLVPAARRRVLEAVGGAGRLAASLAAVTAVLILWLLRSRHHLFGDSRYIGELTASGGIHPAAPLAGLLSRSVHSVLNALFFLNPLGSAAVLSGLSGAIFAVCVYFAAARLTPSPRSGERTLAAAAAAAGGYSVFFFGAGGTPPVALAATALYILAALMHVRGEIPLSVVALALAAAVSAHVAQVFLVPGFLVLAAAAVRGGRTGEAVQGVVTLVLLVTAAAAGFPLLGPGGDPAARAVAAAAGALRSAASDPAGSLAGGLNSILAAGPAALLGAALAVLLAARWKTSRRDGSEAFLLYSALPALALVILAGREAEAGLRWGVFAPAGFVLSLFALSALLSGASRAERFPSRAVMLTALGLFHLAPLVIAGTSFEIGARRLAALPLAGGRAEAVAGIEAWRSGMTGEADSLLAAASRLDPESGEVWYHYGLNDLAREEPLEAVNHFYRAVDRAPSNTRYRTALAEAYIDVRWFEEASDELRLLTAQYPDSARLWTRLGYSYNHSGRYAQAVEAYGKALELSPGDPAYLRNLASAVMNRGAQLQGEGDYEGAREHYIRARMLYPLNWAALNNLAALEMELENWEKALGFLEQGLKEQPSSHELHFNMALVLEMLGDYAGAMHHLRESARLNSFEPPAAEHFIRIRDKLEGSGQAVPADTVR